MSISTDIHSRVNELHETITENFIYDGLYIQANALGWYDIYQRLDKIDYEEILKI